MGGVREAGLLRQYRRELDVPMPELRAFTDALGQAGRQYRSPPASLRRRGPRARDRGAGGGGAGARPVLESVTRDQLVLTEASRSFVDL